MHHTISSINSTKKKDKNAVQLLEEMAGSSIIFVFVTLALAVSADALLNRDNGVPGGAIGAKECKKANITVWHLPYPGDCTKFIKCHISANKSTIYTCDKPLHFNPTIQTCDWPQNAGCESGITPTTIPSENNSSSVATTTSSPSEFDKMCSSATSDRWHLPYPGNCSQFIKCDLVQGTWHIFSCPPPLHFHAAIQVCDWPNNAGCELPPTTTPTTPGSCSSSTPSPTTPTECVTKPVDPPECTSPKPNPTEPNPLPPTATPPTGGNKCPAPFGPADICRVATDHHWHLPHPTDSTKFYKCEINSCRAFLFDCPSGLVFNPTIQVCDWP